MRVKMSLIILSLLLSSCAMSKNIVNQETDINKMEISTDAIMEYDLSNKNDFFLEEDNKQEVKSEEERFKNPYFFPLNLDRQDMTLQTLDIMSLDGKCIEEAYMERDYLFSLKSGDIYKIVFTREGSVSFLESGELDLLGYFYVNAEIIVNITYLIFENERNPEIEITDEKIFDFDYSFPLCYTDLSNYVNDDYKFKNSTFDIKSFEENGVVKFNIRNNEWEILIWTDDKNIITDMRTIDSDNNMYERYVWNKAEGIVGYQYGQGVGGGQHDFFYNQDIMDKYLDRGW